ncbi:MAG: HAD-IA family hydrolase [Candidatus Levybacteria bacterium]|nr:HAD-IA family hydrolase [Candidatus Levybacteria bacterium]
MIKAIVVDVGGVLVQTLDYSPRRLWENKLHLLAGQISKEVYELEPGDLATTGQVKPERIWMDIQKKFALTQKDLSQLELDFYSGDIRNEEFYAFMQSIRAKYQTAILSNAWLDAREIFTNHYHLDQIVDQMIISAEEGMRKPNKEIFMLMLQRLKVQAEEVLYVDDDSTNIYSADALDINAVLFTTTKETIEHMKKFL